MHSTEITKYSHKMQQTVLEGNKQMVEVMKCSVKLLCYNFQGRNNDKILLNVIIYHNNFLQYFPFGGTTLF